MCIRDRTLTVDALPGQQISSVTATGATVAFSEEGVVDLTW